MFTIKVKRKRQDEEFSFGDLLQDAYIIHDDCQEGKSELKTDIGLDASDRWCKFWIFRCKRCDVETIISEHKNKLEEAKLKIIQTAIDSEERQLSDDVRVIQKT